MFPLDFRIIPSLGLASLCLDFRTGQRTEGDLKTQNGSNSTKLKVRFASTEVITNRNSTIINDSDSLKDELHCVNAAKIASLVPIVHVYRLQLSTTSFLLLHIFRSNKKHRAVTVCYFWWPSVLESNYLVQIQPLLCIRCEMHIHSFIILPSCAGTA